MSTEGTDSANIASKLPESSRKTGTLNRIDWDYTVNLGTHERDYDSKFSGMKFVLKKHNFQVIYKTLFGNSVLILAKASREFKRCLKLGCCFFL